MRTLDALLSDLRALAEKWKRPGLTCEPWDDVTDDLRDLIAKHTPKPNKCAECGHAHTPMGCTGDPTPSDLWAGVTPAACDCAPDVSERDELARVVGRELGCVRKGQIDGHSMCGEHHYGWLSTGECPTQERVTDAILAAGWRRR